MFTSTSTSTSTVNVFDFSAIRLPPDFEREGGVRRQLSRVMVRKPRPQEWIRVNPDPAYQARIAIIIYKEDAESKEEIYLVDGRLAKEELGDEVTPATVYLAINRQGAIFLWVCRDENPTMKRGDTAAKTRVEAAEVAKTRYIRVQWRSPAYEYAFRDESIVEVEPTWPDKPFDELIEIAFNKSGMFVADLNHPIIKILEGRN